MQAKSLLVLFAVTAVALVGAWLALREDEAAAGPGDATLLLPTLEERVNDVARVEVTGPDQSLTLERGEDGWGLAERGGYPVQFEKVKEAVVKLARLETREPKSALPENHAKLGVQDPSAEDATSRRVVLKDAAGEVLADVVVASRSAGGRGVYARLADEDQVWLCEGTLTVDPAPTGWIEREILKLESDRVQEATIRHADGSEVVVARDPENHTQFQLQNPPPGREQDFPGVANSVGTALSYLSLEDVRPAAELEGELEPVATATYRCTDGLVVEVVQGEKDGERWVRLDARYEDAGPVVGPKKLEVSDAGDVTVEEEDGEETPDPEAVKAEAAELSERFAPWAYRIVEYKANILAREMEDLLKDPAEEEDLGPPADDALEGLLQEGTGEDSPLSIEELLGGQEETAPEEPAATEGQGEAAEDAPPPAVEEDRTPEAPEEAAEDTIEEAPPAEDAGDEGTEDPADEAADGRAA